MTSKTNSAFADKKMLGRAIKESFLKLNPKTQLQNPVIDVYKRQGRSFLPAIWTLKKKAKKPLPG